MIQLDITEEERQVLAGVLQSYLSDLRMEIANTDSYDFRQLLKDRKEVLEKVLRLIGAEQA